MGKTSIEWTRGDDGSAGETWNPVTGCTKVSPGCDHCYAERITERFHGKGSFAQVQLHEDRLAAPLRWRKPRRVFVNSMSDLFHKDVPDEFIARVFAVMAATPQHTYQILTKRHGRMRSLIGDTMDGGQRLLESTTDEDTARAIYDSPWPLPNVWLGVSVEDQKRADLRVPALIDTSAVVRFLSCEPLLGSLDLSPWIFGKAWGDTSRDQGGYAGQAMTMDPSPLHWVIVGGESGAGARPMHPDWARIIRDDCNAAGVAYFFKQAGSVLAREWGCSDSKGHNPGEWPEAFPREFPYAN